MALKDQVMALKWVKNNIQFFGGNPNSITLAGNSGGMFTVQPPNPFLKSRKVDIKYDNNGL